MQRRGHDSGTSSAIWDLGLCFLWLGPRLDRGTQHLAMAWPDLPALNQPLHPPAHAWKAASAKQHRAPRNRFEPR